MMAIVGIAVGFVFALAVLVLSVVSFPLLLDRDVGVGTAISTSIEVVRKNPGPMVLWGLIIAAASCSARSRCCSAWPSCSLSLATRPGISIGRVLPR